MVKNKRKRKRLEMLNYKRMVDRFGVLVSATSNILSNVSNCEEIDIQPIQRAVNNFYITRFCYDFEFPPKIWKRKTKKETRFVIGKLKRRDYKSTIKRI